MSNTCPHPPQIISHSLDVRVLRRFNVARHSGHLRLFSSLLVSPGMVFLTPLPASREIFDFPSRGQPEMFRMERIPFENRAKPEGPA
jgi:hypothetical protein